MLVGGHLLTPPFENRYEGKTHLYIQRDRLSAGSVVTFSTMGRWTGGGLIVTVCGACLKRGSGLIYGLEMMCPVLGPI